MLNTPGFVKLALGTYICIYYIVFRHCSLLLNYEKLFNQTNFTSGVYAWQWKFYKKNLVRHFSKYISWVPILRKFGEMLHSSGSFILLFVSYYSLFRLVIFMFIHTHEDTNLTKDFIQLPFITITQLDNLGLLISAIFYDKMRQKLQMKW